MSVLIIGGNECMARRYKDICAQYNCKATVCPKMNNSVRRLGSPDLIILFTGTMSHKMLRSVMSELKEGTSIARSSTGSATALKSILERHAVCAAN